MQILQVACLTVLRCVMRPLFLSFTSRNCTELPIGWRWEAVGARARLRREEAGLTHSQGPATCLRAGGARRATRDGANRPGRTPTGTTGRSRRAPRPRSRSPCSPLPASWAKMAAAAPLAALPLPPRLPASAGSCRCGRRGACVPVPRGKREESFSVLEIAQTPCSGTFF